MGDGRRTLNPETGTRIPNPDIRCPSVGNEPRASKTITITNFDYELRAREAAPIAGFVSGQGWIAGCGFLRLRLPPLLRSWPMPCTLRPPGPFGPGYTPPPLARRDPAADRECLTEACGATARNDGEMFRSGGERIVCACGPAASSGRSLLQNPERRRAAALLTIEPPRSSHRLTAASSPRTCPRTSGLRFP